MNENLNLVEILKDCPSGTKLYSAVLGDVTFESITANKLHPIIIKRNNYSYGFSADGKMHSGLGECTLFPSKDQRDWSKFKVKKPKFDPNTLQPFERVLVKNDRMWHCAIFSNIRSTKDEPVYDCCGLYFRCCIPYNDDTKHLLGTKEEASEFYKYWED